MCRRVARAYAGAARMIQEQINIYAKLLEPKDVVKSYAGLYTDEFVK